MAPVPFRVMLFVCVPNEKGVAPPRIRVGLEFPNVIVADGVPFPATAKTVDTEPLTVSVPLVIVATPLF